MSVIKIKAKNPPPDRNLSEGVSYILLSKKGQEESLLHPAPKPFFLYNIKGSPLPNEVGNKCISIVVT